MPVAAVNSGNENVVIGPDAVLDDSPASVVFPDGSYAVIWFRGDGNLINELEYQRFDASGNQIGSPISLEHGTSGFSFINATLLPNGNVAIAYQDNYGSNADVKMTIVTQAGDTIFAPAVIATTIAGEQSDTSVTTLKINGVDQILVTWEDWKGDIANTGSDSAIRARFLNLDGSASSVDAADFQVNSLDTGKQLNADVAGSPNGGGVIVWTDENNASGYTAIKARIINADGSMGSEFGIANQAYHQEHPAVAYLTNGKFVVAYAYNTVDSPEHKVEIRTKIFNADGSVFSNSVSATPNPADTSHKVHPSIEILQDGGFLLTWTEVIDGGTDKIYAQTCSSTGAPIGSALQVSTSPVGDEFESETVVLADGRVLVLYGEAGYTDIHAQIVDARNDTVQTSNTVYSLAGQPAMKNLVFTGAGDFSGTGNGLANTITGGDGNDTLDGGAGADTLHGGLGSDLYIVDNASDLTVEALGAGTDTVQSEVTFALGANVENLTLVGPDAINGTGNDLNNTIIGNSAANSLNGGGGNDTLDGRAGADRLAGGIGNDTYYVDNTGDMIIEAVGAGTDTVKSSISWTLGSTLENLTLMGSATYGWGNALNNVLTGNTAANVLDGGIGADRLVGGAGGDTYYVDNAGDVMIEAVGAGTDTVKSSVSWNLGSTLENLTLIGSSAINGNGNALDNVLIGNAAGNTLGGGAGNDKLYGAAGDDKLYGGVGADYLNGGTGKDAFVFNTALGAGQIDRIADFSVADDTIWLENAIFTKLTTTGVLGSGNFVTGSAALDSNDYVIYNKATGALIYDSNGNAAGGAVQIANLSANLTLTHQDFLVI